MADIKTTNLNLPLPHPANSLEEDVNRIISAFEILDEATHNAQTAAEAAQAAAETATETAQTKTEEATTTADDAKKDAADAQSLANAAKALADTAAKNALTAQNDVAALSVLFPRGIITLWSGATNAVPSGWALCNGANGTPDLRNRFVIGAGSTYAVGAKAGATTHTHTVSGSTNNHTLTTAQMPSHNHSMDAQIPSSPDQHGTGNYIVNTVQTAPTTLYTNNAGSNHGHAHTISSATAGSASNLPPYYALCYIMKL